MSSKIMHVPDPVTQQKRKTCQFHPMEKLREGRGCPVCGWPTPPTRNATVALTAAPREGEDNRIEDPEN